MFLVRWNGARPRMRGRRDGGLANLQWRLGGSPHAQASRGDVLGARASGGRVSARAGVAPACSRVIHHGSEGILPSVALRERDALAPWQTAQMVNKHQYTAHRVLTDLTSNQRATVYRYV
jgi:hypothetical protein